MGSIEAKSPVSGKTLKVYEEASVEEITDTVARAREAFVTWQNTGIVQRLGYLGCLKKEILNHLDFVNQTIEAATGKVELELLASDVMVTLDMIHYYEKHAKKILKKEKRKTPFIFLNCNSYVEYKPIGVVLIISPWNYPFQLAMVPLVTALAAGNTVILKPSEITPTIGELVHFLCRESGLPKDVVQVVQGGGEVGHQLIKAGPDKIFFTGSVETGKKVMKAASRELIPMALELGGKDPMIVFSDANVDRAVRGALYGAFSNAGQICLSVERCYVQASIHQRFIDALSQEVQKLRVGSGFESDLGPIISPHQIPVIEDQIQDALNKGARMITNNNRQGSLMQPVILADVDHSMKVMKDETFGPVLPIMSFTSEDEVIRLANDSIYGLGASVWTSDLEKGKRVARRLVTGNCAVNDVIRSVGNPYLPYGGAKKSGIGRYHGPEGLRSFSIQTSVMVNKGKRKREVNWFPYSRRTYSLVSLMMNVRYQKELRKKARGVIDFLFRKSRKEREKGKGFVS